MRSGKVCCKGSRTKRQRLNGDSNKTAQSMYAMSVPQAGLGVNIINLLCMRPFV